MKASTSLNVRIERWCEMKKFKNFGYKQETVLKEICAILDVDFEEVKDKIPKQPATDLNDASEKLANVVPQEGGDDGGGESV